MTISIPLLLKVLTSVEEQIIESDDNEDKHRWIVFVTYVVISDMVSQRERGVPD